MRRHSMVAAHDAMLCTTVRLRCSSGAQLFYRAECMVGDKMNSDSTLICNVNTNLLLLLFSKLGMLRLRISLPQRHGIGFLRDF
jgi:hypothetical protein